MQILSFLTGNTKLYIALALMAAINCGLYLKLEAQNARLDKAKSDLNITLEANYQLSLSLETMQKEHQKQLEVLSKANAQKEEVKERVEYVTKTIYKEYQRGENNLTRLFNAMVSGLWEQNATANL